jgi:hypothetical protein
MQLQQMMNKRIWKLDDGRTVVPLRAPVEADNGVRYVTVLLDGHEANVRLERLKVV